MPVGYYQLPKGIMVPVVEVAAENRSARSIASWLRRVCTALLAIAVMASPALAYAHGAAPASGATPKASELPPGPVKRLILDVQKQARDNKLPGELIAHPIDEAVRAATRARGARGAGDKRNGSLLDKLASRWAKAAKAVLRAVTAEKSAEEVAGRLREFTTKVKRAEALLTEQQARLGRLHAQVREAEQRAKQAAGRSAKAEAKRLDKAAKRSGKRRKQPKQPPPKPAPAKPKGTP